MTMDLILSLMPIRLIRTLKRSLSEKILISVLMALGLLATAINCAKMTTFTSYGEGDPMQATILPSMYAKLEEVVGIIASCLPCLKQPAENILRRFGILKEHQLSRPSFVQSLPLPDFPKEEQDRRSSSERSFPKKNGVRVDSVSVTPGSAGSNKKLQQVPANNAWDGV